MLLDYIGHYMITKQEGAGEVLTGQLINAITAYVQTHDVYFDYMPAFHDGVLLFGVVGHKKDHKEFCEIIKKILDVFECKLDILLPLAKYTGTKGKFTK